MLYEKICFERQRLEQEIAAIRSELQKLPEGTLICTHSGPYSKWYHSDNHHTASLPKNKKHIAEQLAVKKYLSVRLKALLQEQQPLDFYLRHHSEKLFLEEEALVQDSGYSDLLSAYFRPISPDFTIRHPETGDCYYWEHFGLMDHAAYAQNAFSKMQLYTANGILPSAQLITTYESRDKPLDLELVEDYIRHYFL